MNARDPASARRGRGFTLVELMVGLAILLTLSAVATVSMSKKNFDVATSGLARQIYAMAQQSRLAAMSGRKQVKLTLLPSSQVQQRVALVVGNGPLNATDWGPVEATAVPHEQVALNGITLGASTTSNPPGPSAGPVDIIFYPSGTVQVVGFPGTGATIYVVDRNGQHPYRVLLFGRTGAARVLAQ